MERRTVSAPELKAQIQAERAGRPFLVFRDGDGEQVIRPIDADAELWVGRGGSADVYLEWDEEVSALHAQIEVVRDECTLVDDGLSRNGSFVNEERVHGRRHLRDGDSLRFGRTVLVYRRPGEDAPEATAIAGEVPAAATVSPAQRRVLLALCRPYKDGDSFATPATNQQIGEELHLGVDAVKTHMRALFEKLGIGDVPQNQKRVALVEQALQTGIVNRREL
jgi:pSer/pThr/pTyr-binding forkhead associated (FHA) protein